MPSREAHAGHGSSLWTAQFSLMVGVLFFILLVRLSDAATFTLSWERNNEPDLAGYKLCYGTESCQYSNTIDLPEGDLHSGDPDVQCTYPDDTHVQCTVSNLDDGVRFYFAVKAYDTADNESGFSNEESGILATRLVIDVKVKEFKVGSATELEVDELIGSYMGIP